MWFLDDIYKIGHCDMVLLSALAVLDQIDFHKVEAYDKTESQTEKVRNVPILKYVLELLRYLSFTRRLITQFFGFMIILVNKKQGPFKIWFRIFHISIPLNSAVFIKDISEFNFHTMFQKLIKIILIMIFPK